MDCISDKSHDQLTRRCPRLGGPVSFEYCRTCGDKASLCWKMIDCWWQTMDIMHFLTRNYSEETLRMLAESKPKPKINQLVDLIEQAKKRLE